MFKNLLSGHRSMLTKPEYADFVMGFIQRVTTPALHQEKAGRTGYTLTPGGGPWRNVRDALPASRWWIERGPKMPRPLHDLRYFSFVDQVSKGEPLAPAQLGELWQIACARDRRTPVSDALRLVRDDLELRKKLTGVSPIASFRRSEPRAMPRRGKGSRMSSMSRPKSDLREGIRAGLSETYSREGDALGETYLAGHASYEQYVHAMNRLTSEVESSWPE
ncbi:MAG: hypothetical protein WBE40_00865 [Thermoplasmata archaeon]